MEVREYNMKIDISKLIKPDIDKEFEKIKKYIKKLEEENEFLKAHIKIIKKDNFYFDEIEELKKEICVLKNHSLYFLSNKQQKEVDDFIFQHNLECKHTHYFYTIKPTPIGTRISIKCCVCGKEKDITDYEHF